jgi:hypothetical protein
MQNKPLPGERVPEMLPRPPNGTSKTAQENCVIQARMQAARIRGSAVHPLGALSHDLSRVFGSALQLGAEDTPIW